MMRIDKEDFNKERPSKTLCTILNTSRSVLLGIKTRARSVSGFVPNKTRHTTVLNGFKNICITKPNLYIAI